MAGSVTGFTVVTTSRKADAGRSRLTCAVTVGADPSPAGTTRKQLACSNSPGAVEIGITARSGDPTVDCARASPSAMPCAVDEAITVAISSAMATATRKRNGA